MKKLFCIFMIVISSVAFATKLDPFYNEFLCDEKRDLHRAGLGPNCTYIPFDPVNPTPPPNPLPPPFMPGFLPIVIVNNSSLPDDEVHVVVTGKTETDDTQCFMQISGSGVGTLVIASPGENALQYSLTLADLPETDDGRVIYFPKVNSGVIWFSMEKPLNMPVNPPHKIVQPNFLSSSDVNYISPQAPI
jgi:hypothetical protein